MIFFYTPWPPKQVLSELQAPIEKDPFLRGQSPATKEGEWEEKTSVLALHNSNIDES